MLWALVGRARIIVPTGLWRLLDERGREALLLHELAHYDRRDHWVRLVEFLATALYWWHPILWWLRREMRAAEEQCCDAIVVAALPEHRRSYAEAIVNTLGYLSTPRLVPCSIGIGVSGNVEQRLSRIMLDEPTAPLGGWVKLSAAIIGLGLLPLTPTLAQATRGIEERSDLGTITLAPAGRIEGQVVEAKTGRPLMGHMIGAQALDAHSLSDRSAGWAVTRTDEDGQYVLGGLPAGKFNVLHLGLIEDRQWTAPAVEGVSVVVGEALRANFQVARGKRLFGTVVDGATGAPISRIHVGYYGSARPDSGAACMMVRTKDDGSFEFFTPPGVSKVYVAEGNRRNPPDSSRTLRVRDDADAGPLVLKAGPVVSRQSSGGYGDAEDTAQRKSDAYQASLQLQPPTGMSVTKVEVRTVINRRTMMWSSRAGEKVKVPLGGFADAVAFFIIEAKGFQPARSAEVKVQERMLPLTVPLKAAVYARIRGRVVDKADRPVTDAMVRVRRRIYRDQTEFPWGLEYQTRDDGRFDIEHVRIGDRVQVRIDKEGTGGAVSEWLVPKDQELITLSDLMLGPPESQVGGRVRDYDGLAVAGAKVSLLDNRAIATETDSDGNFLLDGVPVGEIQLSIESTGFPPDHRAVSSPKMDNEIRVNRVSARDRKDHTVRIQLTSADDQSVTNATVYWCEYGGKHLMTSRNRNGYEHPIEFARIARRSAGKPFVVVVNADGYEIAESGPIPNQKNPPPVMIELRPAQPATLRGRVVDAEGEPIANAEVGLSLRLTATHNSEPWRFFNSRVKLPRTDAEGRFMIPDLHVGSRVAVYVNKSGYAGVWSQQFKLEKSGEYPIPDMELPVGTAKISGRVVDERDQPVGGAQVALVDLGPIVVTSELDGHFRFDSIGDRRYPIRVVSEEGEWHGEVAANTTDLIVTVKGG
jgi:protocatechuate 3,4-dioxygenase beta subunit